MKMQFTCKTAYSQTATTAMAWEIRRQGAMKKYEYKFVEVKKQFGLAGITFDECKKVILAEAEQGWRLTQVVTPINEKSGVNTPVCYQIIFEREA